MGPFELMDYIGNDVNYTVTETVFTAFYFDSRYKPSFTQKRMMEAGLEKIKEDIITIIMIYLNQIKIEM